MDSIESTSKVGMVDLGFDSEGDEYTGNSNSTADKTVLYSDDGDPDAVDLEIRVAPDDTNKQAVKVLKPKRKRIKLDDQRLTGTKGLQLLAPGCCRPTKLKPTEKDFPSRQKFHGPGHEGSDIACLLRNYRSWAKQLAPFMSFEDVVEKCEKIGGKLSVREEVQSMRYWTGQFNHHNNRKAKLMHKIRGAATLEEEAEAKNELKDLEMAWDDLISAREQDFNHAQMDESTSLAQDSNNFVVPDGDCDGLEEGLTSSKVSRSIGKQVDVVPLSPNDDNADIFGDVDNIFENMDMSLFSPSHAPSTTIVASKENGIVPPAVPLLASTKGIGMSVDALP
jgi:hypothetical protein